MTRPFSQRSCLASVFVATMLTHSLAAEADEGWSTPRDAGGPVLVGVGAGGIVAGAVVEAIGAATSHCSDPDCATRRKRYIYAGLTTVGVSTSFLYAVGLALWTESLSEPHDDVATEPVDEGVVVLGAVLTVAGAGGMMAGAYMSLVPISCDAMVGGSCTYGTLAPVGGATVFSTSVATFALGLPLWMLYSHELPRTVPRVSFADATAQLTWEL